MLLIVPSHVLLLTVLVLMGAGALARSHRLVVSSTAIGAACATSASTHPRQGSLGVEVFAGAVICWQAAHWFQCRAMLWCMYVCGGLVVKEFMYFFTRVAVRVKKNNNNKQH